MSNHESVDDDIQRLVKVASGKIGIMDDPEFFHGLTMWGTDFSVQIRDDHIVIYLAEDIDRSTENGHPAVIQAVDARRIRDLLNVATARGML